jgi:hypothetical protein
MFIALGLVLVDKQLKYITFSAHHVVGVDYVVTSAHHVTLPLLVGITLTLTLLVGCNFIRGRRLLVARFQQNFNTKVCSFFSSISKVMN